MTIDDCTHGDGCPVHPDVHAVHNFDGEVALVMGRLSGLQLDDMDTACAVALADVAELRAALTPRGRAGDLGLRLDRIEQALRAGGA